MDKTISLAQGLSVALVDENGVFWSKGYGYEDVNRKIKSSPESLYRIASITKPITATAVMILVDRGKLKLDAPITNFISEFTIENEFNQQITIRHLLTHRAGLRNTADIKPFYEVDDNPSSYSIILKSLKEDKLLSPPGDKFKFLDSRLDIEHTGANFNNRGFHSIVVALPKEDVGVIVLSNTTTFEQFSHQITAGILKRLLDIKE